MTDESIFVDSEIEQALRRSFIEEAREHLDVVGTTLLELDNSHVDPAVLNSIFRSVHTIKGSSGSVRLEVIGRVAHAGEDLLSALRAGTLAPRPDLTDELLAMVDLLRVLIDDVEAGRGETAQDPKVITGACERLRALLPRKETAPKPEPVAMDQGFGFFDDPPSPSPAVIPSGPAEPQLETSPGDAAKGEGDAARKPGKAEGKSEANVERTIRVAQPKLDSAINLAGELMIAANSLQHVYSAIRLGKAEATSMRGPIDVLCRITTELHRNAMGMRLIPMRTVFQNAPRTVRDVARARGKRIDVDLSGEGTEVDRQVAEGLADPLMHLIRNSADHGIEPPEVRRERGKSETGRVALKADREGSFVVIDIIDDGGGIDTRRLKAKALENKIIDEATANKMSEEDALQLIFVPGLSTAKAVTDISGRGVGMDVVRSSINGLGGKVGVTSTLGEGTRIRIHIPFTLAVTTALFLVSDHATYALPVEAVRELVKVSVKDLHYVGDRMTFNLRNSVLGAVSLAALMTGGSPPVTGSNTAPPGGDETVQMIVLHNGDEKFGLIVDHLLGQREIVVKPVPAKLAGTPGIGGVTILGDGQVALILDPTGLVALIHDATSADGGGVRSAA